MGKESIYDDVQDNEPIEVKTGKNTLRLMCCDCCLVHDISVKVPKTGNKIIITVNRNNRATSQARRYHKDALKRLSNENKK